MVSTLMLYALPLVLYAVAVVCANGEYWSDLKAMTPEERQANLDEERRELRLW